MNNKKIAIIGCGNLGLSILNGLLKDADIDPNNIVATRRSTEILKAYGDKGVTITSDNILAVKKSDIIILTLKPYNIVSILNEIKDSLDCGKHILISAATGVNISAIQEIVGNEIPVFRAMPNTAADVGESLTCICGSTDDMENINIVVKCFDNVGKTIIINEDLMNAATVLGACGIAYVLRFIRAMIQGGIEIGFDAKTATNIVSQTVKGAAQLLITNQQHPEYEIDKVTTPKGCTIAGLNEMEHNGLSSALIKGIMTSYKKIG